MSHPAAMAYNFNILQAQNRGSPLPYSGVAHPSPLGMGQPSPDKELQADPIRNGVPFLSYDNATKQNQSACIFLDITLKKLKDVSVYLVFGLR